MKSVFVLVLPPNSWDEDSCPIFGVFDYEGDADDVNQEEMDGKGSTYELTVYPRSEESR